MTSAQLIPGSILYSYLYVFKGSCLLSLKVILINIISGCVGLTHYMPLRRIFCLIILFVLILACITCLSHSEDSSLTDVFFCYQSQFVLDS